MSPTEFLPLETSRLQLRRFAAHDVEAFQAYRSDAEVARYQGWDSCSAERAQVFVLRHATLPFGRPGEWFQIAIGLKPDLQIIGDIGLKFHDNLRLATVGFTIARAHQRRGYALEAVSGLFDTVFNRAGVHRIQADTDPENIPSWSLMERLGMKREGHLRQSLWFKGRWADEYLYAILKSDVERVLL